MTSDLRKCLLFWKGLQMEASESSFSVYVCHKRHAALHALRASFVLVNEHHTRASEA